nr:MAG TPA: hypothetical protein [Caudoviricetes sp.]
MIESTDGFMSVRQPAWHGLGTVLDDYPSRKEAQQLVHPWEPVSEPVYLATPMVTDAGDLITQYEQAPEFQGLRRSDNGDLLGIVGDTYTPVLNSELWDVAEALEQSADDVMFETAGSLEGGKKVWILVRLKEPLKIKGDRRGETVPYFALQNSHDGSKAFRGSATVTRIVCANTAQLSDLESGNRGTQFTFRHTKNVKSRIEEAQQALAGWRYSVEQYQQMTEHMLTLDVMPSQVRGFAERWLGRPDPSLVSERVMNNYERQEQEWFDIYGSVTCEGITGTAAGLLQASIEFAEWGRKAHTPESRFKRTYLTQDKLVSSAQQMALEAAGV